MPQNNKNKVRIISGYYKNKKINILPNSNIRPTPDRVRETLFNWLSNSIKISFNHTRILDLFTGSGANSIEAISREAKLVVANDFNINIINHLKHEVSLFNHSEPLSRLTFINHDSLQLLAKKPEEYNLPSFDLIILDPPFNQDFIIKLIDLIVFNNWLNTSNQDSMIYYEAEKKLDINQILETISNKYKKRLNIIKSQTAGDVQYGLICIKSW